MKIISLQNKSTTTESSSGINIGISSSGIPNSIGLDRSSTDGERAYVDNQSTFIAGEGSSLTVGKAANTGAVIGTEGSGVLKITEYTGKDINNYDTMRTTGGSIGLQTGNVPVSNMGYSQESRDKEGIARNTVIGNVEIGSSTGAPINKDLSKANETTKDDHSSTNINIESQTIEYAVNPDKLKEDIGKAKQEISDVTRAFKESVNDRGDDNRNFFGQLSEVRLDETVENIAGEKLKNSTSDSEISEIYRMALKDLGYDNVQIIFSDPKNSPQLIDEKGKPKSGTAFVDGKGVRTIIINAEDPKNSTRSGLIGTLTEEGSHIIGKIEGRQIATGTDEKGLESTGRATNEYFQDKYRGDDTAISIQSDGKDYSNVDFGENVGDYSERLLYGKFDEAAKSTFVNRCGSDVNTCMKLYNLTEEQREKLYSERDKTGALVARLESIGFGVLTGFIGGGFWEVVGGVVAGEIFGHYNDSTPRSNNLKEFEKQQLIIAISEIERTRATLAYLIHTNETTILGDLVNKKNIAVQDLNIANSRIEGNQRIKDVKELKERIRMYKEYSSKKGDAQVDVYINSRGIKPKITPLSAKQDRP